MITTLIQTIKNHKNIFAYVFAIGIIAHGYAFFNSNFSHDSVFFTHEFDILLGRWMHAVVWFFRGGNIFPSVLIGTISLTALSFAAICYIKLFEIRNKVIMFLVSGVLVTNFSLTYIASTYLFFLDINCIAVLFSILAVYLTVKNEDLNLLARVTLSAIFLTMAIALYQAYLQVFCAFGVIYVFTCLVQNKSCTSVLKDIAALLCVCLLGLALYYFSLKFCSHFLKIEFAHGYNSINNAGFDLNIKGTFQSIYDDLNHLPSYSHKTQKNVLIVLLSFSMAVIAFLKVKLQYSLKKMLCCIICLFALLPFASNCVYMISGGLMHALMKYSYSLIFLVPLNLLSYLGLTYSNIRIYRKAYYLVTALVCIFIYNNVVFSNQVYMRKDYNDKASLSLMTRIVSRLDNLENFTPKTPACLVGNYMFNPYLVHSDFLDTSKFNSIIGNAGIDSEFAFTYNPFTYITNFMKFNYTECNVIPDDLFENKEVQNMPVFPIKGSVKMIDGRAVVKLSEKPVIKLD